MSKVKTLSAVRYEKKMTSGRNSPCVFACENAGNSDSEEFVVKLKGSSASATGLMFELLATQMAQFLDIPVPEAAIIEIEYSLAEAISDTDIAAFLKKSVGKNFGSKFLSCGFCTWPKGKAVPGMIRQTALEIFTYDAMIQNPDRTVDNPNILYDGEYIYTIDYELGFSFINAIDRQKPWEVTELTFMKKHLFYSELKGKEVNLNRFAGAVESLEGEVIREMIANIPSEWRSIESCEKITEHILAIRNNLAKFILEIRRLLT